MNAETLKRARWVCNSPTTKILKCAAKDGGAVLAIVTSVGSGGGYVWQAAGKSGTHRGWYGAIFAARRALREEVSNAEA